MKTTDKSYVEAVIALFKAVPTLPGRKVKVDEAKLTTHGLVLADGAATAMPGVGTYVNFLVKTWGYDLLKANAALHKSFGKVRNASAVQLFIEQVLHYMSVYLQPANSGDEWSPVAVNADCVYVPAETLNLPADTEPVKFTVIHALDDKAVVTRAKAMLQGMALTDSVQKHLLVIVARFQDKFTLAEVHNKEFRVMLMDKLGLMPVKASELLRFLVYKKTGLPMVVHSRRSVAALLANKNGYSAVKAVNAYVTAHGVEGIAREFNRHRNFWVALKHDGPEVAKVINRARKLAPTLNKPAVIGPLDRIGDATVTLTAVRQELKNVTLWKKVAVANSLLRRAGAPKADLYTVRTGRSYAVQRKAVDEQFLTVKRTKLLDAVVKSIVAEVKPHVKGLRVNLPANVDYAFPTSLKAFVGPVPFWTTVDLGPSAVVGIHWVNVMNDEYREERVDLDLHYTSPQMHVGWNTDFWDGARRVILHSGDLTNAPAPLGASEAVYVGEGMVNDFAVLSVNQYTDNTVPTPYTLFVGTPGDVNVDRDYLLGAHELLVNINGLEGVNNEDMIGFVESTSAGKKLHFLKTGLGRDIVSSYNANMAAALTAVQSTLTTRLSLRTVLEQAGAVFELAEGETWDVDLDLTALTADSFMFLTSGVDG